jgi:hypothetical protein
MPFDGDSDRDMEDIYVIVVNVPGSLPTMEPYAVRGLDMAYGCARAECSGETVGYSRAEFNSAVVAGGAAMYFEEDETEYVCEVVPLDRLDLPSVEVEAYIEEAEGQA